MSYPILLDKHQLPAMLSAQQMIEFRRAQGGLRGIAAPHSIILCLYKGVMRRFAWRYPSRRVRGFLGDLYLIRRGGERVGVMGNFGIGAPAVTNQAEELIAWGTRRLVILSLAGGLQPELYPRSIVVCDRALRDEGTSYHYLPPGREVGGSDALASSICGALASDGISASRGATWSTDAPYRETQLEAEQFGREGVMAVDMESAGLYAAAQVRGVEAASVFVIGDSLAGPRWSAPPDMRALHMRLKQVLDALIKVLQAEATR